MKHLELDAHQSSTRTLISCLLIFCASLMPNVSAITCKICGQSNLTAPGECTNQFPYDCLSNPTNGGQQSPIGGQAKILCRTTRTKLGENQFAVVKECVTETEHLNKYPDGKAFGCETVQTNSSFPVTYCVCDQDRCNERSLDEQLSQPQPVIPNTVNGQAPPTPVGALPPQPQLAVQQPRQFNRTANNPQAQPDQRQPQPGNNPQILPDQRQQQQGPSQSQNVRAAPPLGPQQAAVPSQPVDQFVVPANPSWDPNQVPQNPSFVQEPPSAVEVQPKTPGPISQVPQGNQQQPPRPRQQTSNTVSATTPQVLVHINTERIQFLPESNKTTTNPGKRTPSPNGFVCMVCGEGNLTQSQDCQIQNPLDCRSLFRPGANLFCFTKAITLPTGQAQIEKRCASEEQLTQELGIPTIQPSCFSGQDGHVRMDYCICGTSKCNQLPIANQANMYPPLTTADRIRNPNPVAPGQIQPTQPNVAANPPTQQTKMCYVCGESDQANPSDCSQQYEYDCSRQYPQGSTTVLCLTRQTKLASGRFNIEKRCITPAEHQLQYPDNEVTLNGCNEAWNGYVQYCVCQGDFCNSQNITLQQQAHHWTQKPVDIPDEDSFNVEDKPKTTPAQFPGQQSPIPRLPNGLLVPPSTRLPLSPLQPSTPLIPITKTGGRASAATPFGNAVQEPSSPFSPAPITKETPSPSPWDNRIRHDGQHRSSPSENSSKAEQKKRGPTSSRQGNLDEGDAQFGKSSTTKPGYYYALALFIITFLMLQ